ncbi:MAG: hypothetical protein L7S06_04590 [Candidatus Actinomarina sp.]|nr:hypothetical protein [Candidatus Actinomarina sp.]|tara:strand:- start:463 stop:837 length:375 start_codon:yes stop_codon:yes gene_type:complete
MFKSKYTLWFIAFLIGTSLYNIFAIVQIEFNTVSLYSFKKFTIECGTIYDLLSNNVDFSSNKNLSMNRSICVNQAIVTLSTSLLSIIFLLSLFIYGLRVFRSKDDYEDMNTLLAILRRRNNKSL